MASSSFNIFGNENWTCDLSNVDISEYTSAQNAYECPKDGYLVIGNPTGSIVRITDSSTYFAFSGVPASTGTNYTSYFVRKGMRLFVSAMPSGGSAYFRGLKTY